MHSNAVDGCLFLIVLIIDGVILILQNQSQLI